MDIVQNILKLAKEKKITNQQLCKILETNPNKIYDWKIGKSKPSAEDISKLADCFDVSTDYLLGRHSPSEIKKDDSTEALPSADKLTPSQQKLVEYASDLTNEELQETLDFIGYLKAKRSN